MPLSVHYYLLQLPIYLLLRKLIAIIIQAWFHHTRFHIIYVLLL